MERSREVTEASVRNHAEPGGAAENDRFLGVPDAAWLSCASGWQVKKAAAEDARRPESNPCDATAVRDGSFSSEYETVKQRCNCVNSLRLADAAEASGCRSAHTGYPVSSAPLEIKHLKVNQTVSYDLQACFDPLTVALNTAVRLGSVSVHIHMSAGSTATKVPLTDASRDLKSEPPQSAVAPRASEEPNPRINHTPQWKSRTSRSTRHSSKSRGCSTGRYSVRPGRHTELR